ncbi:UNVERIFIED_CONTAM: hypothetical protein FKN15_042330 [Acipenser sinensis]
MQGYQNLPIDIQTSKLLDWLVDRRHCNLKWQSSVLQIRGKINTAIQDMPENEEIKTLLAGSCEYRAAPVNVYPTLLEVFLTQRLCEMGEEGDVLSMSQFQLAPVVIQSQTRDKVLGVLSLVKGLIERLTSVRMQHLFMIQASPRYVDRVTELLRQKLKQADILVLKQQAMAERRQEALREQGQLEPRIDLLVQRTKELQKQASTWQMT